MSENIHFPFNEIITEGDDRTITMTFTQADGVTPQDITTWNFFYTAKSSTDDVDGSAVLSLDAVDFTKSDSGGGTTDTITFTLELASGPVLPGTYEQDLQIVVGGAPATIGRGQLVVEAQVTIREA
jgi:hypothetical protein